MQVAITIGQKGSGNVIVPVTNLTKRTKELALTVTSAVTGWTVVRAVGIAYADSAGAWRLAFNVMGTVSSASLSNVSATLAGFVFKNVGYQTITAVDITTAGAGWRGYASPGASILVMDRTSAITIASVSMSGDVELDAEPTWASVGAYTALTALEGVANIAAYIPFGQAGMPGEEKIEYAPSEVYTTSTAVFDWSGSNVTLGVGTWDLTMSVNYALRIDSGTGALYGFLYIRDTSNNTIPYSKVLVQSDFQGSGIRTLLGVVQLTKRVVLTSSTSYKISMDSPSTTGSAYMYIKGGNSSAITTTSLRAVRIAP